MSRGCRERKGGRFEERGEYYQTICRHFLSMRGAPFFLSSQEIELIAEWERMNIPVSAVLEGIQRAFEDRHRKPGRQGRFFSLSRCRGYVLESYKQHRERGVGKRGSIPVRGDREKKKKVLREIEEFLSSTPQQGDLCRLFIALRRELQRGRCDEESLERAEAAVEEILLEQASPQERGRIEAEVRAEFGLKEGFEFDRIVGLKLIKKLRTKHKVPHLSLFYY